MTEQITDIRGSGGGKGGKTAADNLQSRAVARFTDLISEGPIVGLVNGAKSIYFNKTPLQNEDGSFNFDNVIWQERKGLADDEHLNGSSAVEQVNSVEVEVKKNTGPVTRTITAPDADAVRVIVRLNSLMFVDSKGNVKNHSVSYAIDMRVVGSGTWTRVVTKDISKRKTSAPTQIAHRIALPLNGPWDIRVTRLSDDDPDEKTQSDIFWESYIVLTEGRFTYPHSALVNIEVNAEDLGTQIPQRGYHVKGRIISVPVNFDPEARTYSGIWNGTFKQAWTNDPAWIFYDLIENDRYGIGEFVDASQIDKWSLYEISKNNCGMVPSGFKDDFGADIMEPRYTFNGVIQNREDAYFALQQITTAWRGMGYWAIGQYFATADMPSDPVKLVTPANVIGGEFIYSSTAMKARNTVAVVKWNDPNDFYQPATELVINEEGLRKNGWREKRVDLPGCTSRGLAMRYGRWILDTENKETETVTYVASFDHADVRPGNIIAIADPRRALVRMGGRIVSHTAGSVVLDADVELLVGETYQIYLTKPDGSILTLNVLGKSAPNTLSVAASSEYAEAGSVFIVTGSDVAPALFRVLLISETEENLFSITALQHDPTKYARVESNIVVEAPKYARERPVSAPTALDAIQENYIEAGVTKSKVMLSWTPPAGVVVRNYVIEMQSPAAGMSPVGTTTETSIDVGGLEAGEHVFNVFSVDRKGIQSLPAAVTVNVLGAVAITGMSVANLSGLGSSGASFEGSNAAITWENVFPVSSNSNSEIGASPLYLNNVIEIRDTMTNALLRTETVVSNSYNYGIDANRSDSIAAGFTSARRSLKFAVTVSDINGNVSAPAQLTLTNAAPATFTPSITVEGAKIMISWANPTDIDYAGTLIWVKEGLINPAVDVPFFDGTGGTVIFTGEEVTSYNIRVAHYDAFGKEGINISPNIPAVTTRFTVFDMYGDELFSSTGLIGGGAYVNVGGSNIQLSEIAVNSLTPSLNYVGEFATAPTSVTLGADWKQNAIYKNSTDGKSYVLTGSPLAWVVYLEDGRSFNLVIESTNGTIFRLGQGQSTLLKARVFKNGAEVTTETPDSWFKWRRVSVVPQSAPNDDASWNALYTSGYKEISVSVDQVFARATFFCDIISTP